MSKNQWKIIDRTRFTIDPEGQQQWTFKEHPDTHECTFRKDGGCLIYKSRPLACRVYPATGEGHVCHAGVKHQPSSTALVRQFRKALKEWQRATLTWRQEKLMELKYKALEMIA
jgi:Fe-S-cluster containining protein